MQPSLTLVIIGVTSTINTYASSLAGSPASTHAHITAAPKLVTGDVSDNAKRQDYGPDFIGWQPWSSSWFSYTCPSQSEYAATGQYGACCPLGGPYCNYPTACSGNKLVYINSGSADCAENTCDAVTVFASRDAAEDEIHTIYQCFSTSGFREAPRSIFRVQYPLTTSTPTLPPALTPESTHERTVTVEHTAQPDSGSRLQGWGRGTTIVWCVATVVFMTLVGTLAL